MIILWFPEFHDAYEPCESYDWVWQCCLNIHICFKTYFKCPLDTLKAFPSIQIKKACFRIRSLLNTLSNKKESRPSQIDMSP